MKRLGLFMFAFAVSGLVAGAATRPLPPAS